MQLLLLLVLPLPQLLLQLSRRRSRAWNVACPKSSAPAVTSATDASVSAKNATTRVTNEVASPTAPRFRNSSVLSIPSVVLSNSSQETRLPEALAALSRVQGSLLTQSAASTTKKLLRPIPFARTPNQHLDLQLLLRLRPCRRRLSHLAHQARPRTAIQLIVRLHDLPSFIDSRQHLRHGRHPVASLQLLLHLMTRTSPRT